MWKIYKSKVLQTLNPEYEEDTAEEQVTEVENDVMSPVQENEAPNAVYQLARRIQGAGTRGWNRLSALFNQDDEHQLLEETESPPVADHPLAVKPEEPPRPARRSGFWDSFAASWAAKKQAEAAAAAAAANEAVANEAVANEALANEAVANEAVAGQGEEGVTGARGEESQDRQVTVEEESEGGEGGEGGDGGEGGRSSSNRFSKYVSLGRGGEEVAFKWNFVTNKLAELKTKTN